FETYSSYSGLARQMLNLALNFLAYSSSSFEPSFSGSKNSSKYSVLIELRYASRILLFDLNCIFNSLFLFIKTGFFSVVYENESLHISPQQNVPVVISYSFPS